MLQAPLAQLSDFIPGNQTIAILASQSLSKRGFALFPNLCRVFSTVCLLTALILSLSPFSDGKADA